MSSTLLELAGLPALIDAAQAARVLGCSHNYVLRMCASGSFFSAVKLGTHWRINTADLVRWVGLEDDVEAVRRALGLETEDGGPESSPVGRPVPVIAVLGCEGQLRFTRSARSEATELIG